MQAIDQTGQVYIYILALADLALAYSAVTLSTKLSTQRSTRETAKFNHNPPCKVPFFAVSGVALPNCSRPAKARMIETTCHPMVKTLTILQKNLMHMWHAIFSPKTLVQQSFGPSSCAHHRKFNHNTCMRSLETLWMHNILLTGTDPGEPMPVLHLKGLIGICSANEFAHGIFA